MQTIRRPLPVIKVQQPCTASWDDMKGDQAMRFCSHCQLHVHNLSAMPADEAERLVCESAGRLCVRFERMEDGRVKTLEYASPPKPRFRTMLWSFLTVMGIGSACGTGIAVRQTKPTPPPVVMGEMICPLPPPKFGTAGIAPGTTVTPQNDPTGEVLSK